MADIKLKVTRDQLYKIFKDHELVKQFERLFDYINILVPLDDTDSAVTASTAITKATEAINELFELRKNVEALNNYPSNIIDEIFEIKKDIEVFKQSPYCFSDTIYEIKKELESLKQLPVVDTDGLYELNKIITPKTWVLGVDISLLNSWVEFSSAFTPKLTKVGNVCYMSGLVKSGAADVILSIPADLRPSTNQMLTTTTNDTLAVRMEVKNNGDVQVVTYSTVWTSIKTSWVIGQ